MAWSRRPTVSTRMCRFLPLISAQRLRCRFLPASYPCGSMHAFFFRAFHALAVDDGGGRTGFPLLLFATLLVERVVDSFQRAVIRSTDRSSRRPSFSAAGLSGSRATSAGRRSDRSDIATCCGPNGRGSCSSTSVSPPRIRPPLLNHR
jgi:hypothetical protein